MAMVASDNEGSASEVRVTRDGRKITYKINVLQHPEKARACGQGAKSSTDRRPVDPPPILDLRIFEEDADGSEKDITFSYRANFFMWASLELARPVAAVRGSKDTQNTPVLCGSPVSGISYLDRPSPAGYFIFPDLSVRHEGRYRLCFMLYEELRDYPLDDRAQPDGTARPQAADCVNGRCIVRSRPFTVFSAKKFPGLSESTILSRTVAEQGCRVRIRRDVRMRRRDSKGVKDDYFEDDEPEEEDNRPASPGKQLPLPAEPTTDSSRTTSTGNGATYQAMHRNSASDLNAQYNGYTQPVPTPQPYAVQQYEQSGIPQYVPPQYVAQHSPAAQYPPPTYGYPQYYAYPQYAYMSQPVQPVFAQPQQPPMRHDNLNYTHSSHDFNQPPAQYGSQIQQIDNNRAVVSTGQMSMNGVQNHTHQDSPHSRSNSTYNRNSLPPIQTQPSIQSNGSYDSYSAHPTTTPHQYSAQTHQSYTSAIPEPYRTQPQPPAHYLSSTPSDAPKAKRSYASTFSTQHGDERLQGGARPDTDRPALTAGTSEYGYAPLLAPDGPAPGQNSSDDDDSETLMMEYKRADGTIMQRRWRNG